MAGTKDVTLNLLNFILRRFEYEIIRSYHWKLLWVWSFWSIKRFDWNST